MVLIAPAETALATRVRLEEDSFEASFNYWRTTFIGTDGGKTGVVASQPHAPADSDTLYPVAYRIELDPRSGLDVHFHRANQFQVIVDGDGRIGRHPVGRVCVHYAGAYTAYGPICPGDAGLTFYTLRDAFDPSARSLPAHKAELRLNHRPRREAFAARFAVPDPVNLAATGEPRCETLLSSPDAMGAWALTMPPGAPLDPPGLAGSGGQFWLVLAGTLCAFDRPPLTPWSCIYLGPDDAVPPAAAGAEGLSLLVLRLPARVIPDARATNTAGAASVPPG